MKLMKKNNREQKVSLWRDWYWSLKQYLLVVDGKYETDLEEVERADHEEVDWDLLDDDEQHRGRFMYSLRLEGACTVYT